MLSHMHNGSNEGGSGKHPAVVGSSLALGGTITSPAGLSRLRENKCVSGQRENSEPAWLFRAPVPQPTVWLSTSLGKHNSTLGEKLHILQVNFQKKKKKNENYGNLCEDLGSFSLLLTKNFFLEGIILQRHLIVDLRKQISPNHFLCLMFF